LKNLLLRELEFHRRDPHRPPIAMERNRLDNKTLVHRHAQHTYSQLGPRIPKMEPATGIARHHKQYLQEAHPELCLCGNWAVAKRMAWECSL
jgi:hypothetical protein